MSQEVAHYPEPLAPEGSAILANRSKFLISLVVLIGALSYFAFIAFQSATVYYYTVGELDGLDPIPAGKVVRVSGKLVPDSFHRVNGSTVAQFALTDGAENLLVAHDGVLPDLFFNEHSEIILEGSYTQGEVFQSQNVIVRCPSKYIAVNQSG